VLRLESYEDALHNLATEETLKKEKSAAKAHKEKLGSETYRLHYLAKLPLEANACMLNVEKLEHPFSYTIEVLTEDGPKTETVDLVETFNYLYPIDGQRIETWLNKKDTREYRVIKGRNREGRRILVLWRDMEKLNPKIEREFIEDKVKSEGPFDEMLINGDTATPGFVSLDPVFKRLIEEEER
jgi:adenine-specific DNA-methyltransferase